MPRAIRSRSIFENQSSIWLSHEALGVVKEPDVLAGRLAASSEVRALRDRMETWSQLILDAAEPAEL